MKLATNHSTINLHPALRGVRAVLFDVGGTLTHPDWPRLASLARDEAGSEFESAELERVFKNGLREVDACLKRGEQPPCDTGRRNWTFTLMYGGLGVEDAACERLSARLDEIHAERHLWCGIDTDAASVLGALRQAKILTAAVSNTEDGRLAELLELIGLGDHFDQQFDSFVVRMRKPDPAIFALALASLGVEPREAAFVGDSYGHDCLPALAAGMRAVLIDPLDLHTESVCPRVRSLGELVGQSAGL